MKVAKNTLYLIASIILVLGSGYFLVSGGTNVDTTGNVVVAGNGEIQEITVGMKNYNYYPNTIKVKAGSPVRMKLDSTVYGCFRDLTLREFGIREYLKTPNDYVEFTPTKPGRYTFACSMGMGAGTLIVE